MRRTAARVPRYPARRQWFLQVSPSKPGRLVKFAIVRRACLSLALAGFALGGEATPPESARTIAVTFDDLPAVSVPAGETCDLAALKANTAKLLATLTCTQCP
jgi:hypothetical protein